MRRRPDLYGLKQKHGPRPTITLRASSPVSVREGWPSRRLCTARSPGANLPFLRQTEPALSARLAHMPLRRAGTLKTTESDLPQQRSLFEISPACVCFSFSFFFSSSSFRSSFSARLSSKFYLKRNEKHFWGYLCVLDSALTKLMEARALRSPIGKRGFHVVTQMWLEFSAPHVWSTELTACPLHPAFII